MKHKRFVQMPYYADEQLTGNELKLLMHLIKRVSFYENVGKTYKRSLREISKVLHLGKNCNAVSKAKKSLKEKGFIDYVDGVYGGDTDSTSWFINWSVFDVEETDSISHPKGDRAVTKKVTEQSPKELLNSHQNGDIYNNTNKNTILDYQPEYQTASLDEKFERELWS